MISEPGVQFIITLPRTRQCIDPSIDRRSSHPRRLLLTGRSYGNTDCPAEARRPGNHDLLSVYYIGPWKFGVSDTDIMIQSVAKFIEDNCNPLVPMIDYI